MSIKIKKGDKVVVLAGKDKGRTGKVLKVFPINKRLVVEGVNIMKKHTRRRSETEQGGMREISVPINASNVLLFCSGCNRGVRFSVKVSNDKSKVRICKKCQKVI